jgi:hypothetical protein
MSDPALIFLTDHSTTLVPAHHFLTDHSTMLVPALHFLTDLSTMSVPAHHFLPIIRQCRYQPFINRSFDNVGSSPSFLTDHSTMSFPALLFFIRKELRTKTIFHIVIYTSIDWVIIGKFLHLNRWIDNIVKTIFLQTIIWLYLLMVLTDNSICRSSDLVFKRQTDNTISKANQ